MKKPDIYAIVHISILLSILAGIMWYASTKGEECSAKGGTLMPVMTSDWPYGCFKVEKAN